MNDQQSTPNEQPVPFYKRTWFLLLLAAVIVLFALGFWHGFIDGFIGR